MVKSIIATSTIIDTSKDIRVISMMFLDNFMNN